MEVFGEAFSNTVIIDQRNEDYSMDESTRVLSSEAPRPVVNPFGEVVGDTRVVQHLGPSTVTNNDDYMKVYGTGQSLSSMELSEEVFLGQNFDNRDYYDSALPVEYQIDQEMGSQVVEVMPHNSEITDKHLVEGSPRETLADKIKKIDKKDAIIGAALLFLFLRK